MLYNSFSAPQRQKGSVLLVSIMLLATLAILGLSTLQGTATNELIAANMHQRTIGFQASESAIQANWSMDDFLDNTPDSPTDDPPAAELLMNTELDMAKVDLSVSATIQYCGESSVMFGTNLNADQSVMTLAAQLFDVHGVAVIDNTRVRSDHLQRGFIVRPRSGRLGNCP